EFSMFIFIFLQEFRISPHEAFVVATTDRTTLDFDKFKELQDGSTLYLLQNEHQALPVAAEEHITFTPHYDTLIRGGMYEYYASQGQAPLSYTLAELIDNALSATAKNKGRRIIEIRVLNDKTVGKPAVIVLDNGCGMTSKQLNNWAVYRLSKFTKESSTFASDKEGYVRPDHVPRSLNSDISYFGVGGKQAVFYIGDSARMISKPVGSPDVHELVLSKEEFERKEKNKEDIFSGVILNRKPGDSSHIKNNDEHFLQALIAEERGKESFTAVVITGVQPEHITFLTERFNVVTRELAHIYHYYIHGVNGNVRNKSSSDSDDLKIDIHVTLREKPPKCPRAIHLREVEDDMQTLYINAAADTFEFRASTAADNGTVEGIIRYHPFLYDKETYPKRPGASYKAPDNDDDDNESGFTDQARKRMPIFECFWNGRLIPYTAVSEFDWCSPSKGAKELAECYSRLSGVLFTDDRFQVTTNKLTFTDLEMKLKNKDTIYTTVVNGQKSSKRANIQNEFSLWLQNCHEKFDKQVKFLGYQGTITRPEVPSKKMQHPWAMFSSIEWDGKTYKTGQRVKSLRTNPVLYGTIVKFLLYGSYDGDVFATGGQVEVIREPKALYDMTKIIPISKIDKTATDEAIKKNIDNDFAKLPEWLKVVWPKGNEWPQNAVCPAGTPLGPINVEILNKRGESISSMPSAGQGKGPVLSMQLTIVLHDSKGDKVVSKFIAQHSPKWGFEFKKNESLTQLGKYTLFLNTVMKDTNEPVFGGKKLPNFTLKFTVKGKEKQSSDPSVRVGVPFNIPLQFKDLYGNLTAPPKPPPVLECNYDLKVTLSGLKTETQTVKIILHPGTPHSLHVMPEEDPVKVENGNPVAFNVEIHDECGNITAHPRQIVRCSLTLEELPLVTVDCSNTGAGQLMTKPINLKIIDGQPQTRKVQFEMPSQRHIASITRELKVIPSTRVALMQVYSAGDDNLVLRNNDKIDWVAGGVLENLFYRLYDEAGSEVTISAEIASKIKVNWTGDIDLEDLIHRRLPDIEVPTQVQDERFFQVSYHDQSVSVSFTITSSVVVTGIRFSSGPLGLREMCFKYSTYVEHIKIEVTAGIPAQLKLISGPEQVKNVKNLFSHSCVVHCCFIFTLLTIEAHVSMGCYKLQFTGFFNKKPIPGPSVNLTIIPDRNKPVRLSVEYDSKVRFLAGGIFPVFSVTVVSEEESPITTFSPTAVSMRLWSGVSSGGTPPPTVGDWLTDVKLCLLRKCCVFFCRDKQIPEHAGPHVIQFSLRVDETKLLFSDQIPVNVVANQPVKLGPDSQPRTPVVSNSKDITSRTLVENMTLRIMDSHGNPAGQDLNGRVAVSIKCTNGDKNKSLPLFEGKIHSFRLDLVDGKAYITRLAIIENSPGENGSIYTLLFQPEVPKFPTPLNPFELEFHFYNDADNQAKISHLTKQKDELTVAIAAYENIFLTSTQLLKLLTAIDTLINKKRAEVDKILKMPRRSCSIRENFMLQPDVLGMVGHLAFVEDDTAAWVISWHIRGDMDCIITKTKEAAERIYRETQGKQQVMALDSVFVPPRDRPLPHIRYGRTLFDPPGNPVYARELLICPNDQECCDIVFKNILGDTIVIDDLQSANNYRRAVVQNKSPCPTILTRQGDRVSGKGKFGGAQNKAPPMQTLPLFGAPFPPIYHTLRNDIELLQQYQLAVKKREEAEKERSDHIQNLKSPEMERKNQEMEEKKKLLEDIERQLGMFVDHGVSFLGAHFTHGVITVPPKQKRSLSKCRCTEILSAHDTVVVCERQLDVDCMFVRERCEKTEKRHVSTGGGPETSHPRTLEGAGLELV
uniref:SMC hinge domain-containing protein n=1 Tax=Amphiprion ocellaris TaxID=80972 RepID=A0AAQ5ZH41_AMPOC